jgi:hypothetical protein
MSSGLSQIQNPVYLQHRQALSPNLAYTGFDFNSKNKMKAIALCAYHEDHNNYLLRKGNSFYARKSNNYAKQNRSDYY